MTWATQVYTYTPIHGEEEVGIICYKEAMDWASYCVELGSWFMNYGVEIRFVADGTVRRWANV